VQNAASLLTTAGPIADRVLAPKGPSLPSGQALAEAFEKRFGVKPKRIAVVGSVAQGTADESSDIDVIIISDVEGIEKNTGEGFEYFKEVNPGKVPEGITEIGPYPEQGHGTIGAEIPKAGTIDPFFFSDESQATGPFIELYP